MADDIFIDPVHCLRGVLILANRGEDMTGMTDWVGRIDAFKLYIKFHNIHVFPVSSFEPRPGCLLPWYGKGTPGSACGYSLRTPVCTTRVYSTVGT